MLSRGHAYSIRNMVCNAVTHDGPLARNPRDVRGAMNSKAKRNVTHRADTRSSHVIDEAINTEHEDSDF
jgi:hypothetical protein